MPRPHEKMEAGMSLWFKHLQESKKSERRGKHGPFVTISRESGAYGMTIADMLAEHLRSHERRRDAFWAVFDKELVQKLFSRIPRASHPGYSRRTIRVASSPRDVGSQHE